MLNTIWVGFFFLRMKICEPLCFWFLCDYQQLLEISQANHITVHVVEQSERQLSPLALVIKSKKEMK